MHRAKQPVIVHRVKFYSVSALQDLWSANQRYVVIVDNVKALIQNFSDTARLEERQPSLLCSKGRAKTKRTFNPVNGHIRMILIACVRFAPRQKAIGIDTVDDVDRMSAVRQLIG